MIKFILWFISWLIALWIIYWVWSWLKRLFTLIANNCWFDMAMTICLIFVFWFIWWLIAVADDSTMTEE